MKTRAEIAALIDALDAEIPAIVAQVAPPQRIEVFVARAEAIGRNADPQDHAYIDARINQTAEALARQWAALR